MIISTLIGLFLTLQAPQAAERAEYQPVVGQLHPDLTLPDIATGRPVSLRQFRGRKVLLVHFASW